MSASAVRAVIAPTGLIHALAGRCCTLCGTALALRRLGRTYRDGWVLLPSSFTDLHQRRRGSKICAVCLDLIGQG